MVAQAALHGAQVDTLEDHRQGAGVEDHPGLPLRDDGKLKGPAGKPLVVDQTAGPIVDQDLQHRPAVVHETEHVAGQRVSE